jgi:hypothetical protein
MLAVTAGPFFVTLKGSIFVRFHKSVFFFVLSQHSLGEKT